MGSGLCGGAEPEKAPDRRSCWQTDGVLGPDTARAGGIPPARLFGGAGPMTVEVRFASDASAIDGGAPLREDAQHVWRKAFLFEAGSYPDRDFSLQPDELKAAAEQFDQPIDLDIEHAKSPLDHKLGQLVG